MHSDFTCRSELPAPCSLLIGIVKKNAIMVIDRALVHQRQAPERPLDEAIAQAATERLRPNLMTTFAAAVGALPLALDDGMGSELRRPLGIVILSGLTVSQLITLYSVPVVHRLLAASSARKQAARALTSLQDTTAQS